MATAGVPAAGAADPAPPQVAFRGVAHDMLYGVSFEGQAGIAVGDFGLVLESADGGKSWQRQSALPSSLGLFAVARRNGHCIAAGQQGTVLASSDCKRWSAVASGTKARILGVHVNANGMAWAVGGFGTVLRSSDWGHRWEVLQPDWKALTGDTAEPHLYAVHVAEDGTITMAGEFELVLRSRDNGASWSALRKGRRSLFGLHVAASGDIYAVGQEGVILKGSPDGAQWTEQASGTKSILTGIWSDANGSLVASGIYTLLRSADGGKSWRQDASSPARAGWHLAVAAAEERGGPTRVVTVGSGGTILSMPR